MSAFFHCTNFTLLTPELKKSILESIDTECEISTKHKPPNNTEFTILKLPKELNDKVLKLLPAMLTTPDLDPFIRVQYTANGNISPHIDKGRISGLLTVLTDDNSPTDFYKWKPDASQELLQGLVVADSKELLHEECVVFERDKTYLFDHASIHDVTAGKIPRITLNIFYQNLPYTKLVEMYSKLVDQ